MTRAGGRRGDALERTHPTDWCPGWMSNVSCVWFWVTIVGVFYVGMTHVLPTVYEGRDDWFFSLHHLCCYVMFAQMMINWLLVRMIQSPFRPELYPNMNLQNGGFEINLNHLKAGQEPGTYTIPSSSVCGVDINDDCVEKTCVLKRDHHCFFTGSCIGAKNQRHFCVFAFWALVATAYCLYHCGLFTAKWLQTNYCIWDLFLPITCIRAVLGYAQYLHCLMIFLLYSLIWFFFTSLTFVLEQYKTIRKGVTSFEESNNLKIQNSNSISQNIEGVFGKRWWLNFIFPAAHKLYPSADNGVVWKNIKV